jgi:phospholipid-binding lipoprotein MlaA
VVLAASIAASIASGGSAWAATATPVNREDPWEHFNRGVYRFNQGLDRAILRPAAMGYRHALPSPVRQVVRNFLSNLTEPNVIINDILQLRPKRAAQATGRLVLNSTVGLAGFLDVASRANLPHQDTSFSITLGRYGVRPGPYLYLPVVGPSTVRGLVGFGADSALDPLYWIRYPHKTEISISRTLVHGLDARSEADGPLRSLTSDATDPYATIRSAYLQNQQSLVNGDASPIQSLPDFDEPAPTASPPSSAPPTDGSPTAAPAPSPAAAPPALADHP